MPVKVVTEGRRGCGYRKKGGLYLRSDGVHQACPALPIEMVRCPCCDGGIKPARGWTWINPTMMFKFPCPPECSTYQLRGRCAPFKQEKAGLLWIGGKFYSTPEAWLDEVNTMGVSRRIASVPKNFKLGQTWVFMGHRKAVTAGCTCTAGEDCELCDGTGEIKKPGIFHVFIPTAVEKVVGEDITDEEIEQLEKRNITPVIINRVDDNGNPVDENGK